MLKISILVDNHMRIDSYLKGEPGFSAWIECGGRRLLLDTGYSDVAVRNAPLMGIDLCAMDALIYSHGHNDHTWGTHAITMLFDRRYMKRRPELVAHPRVFENKRAGGLVIGTMMTAERLENYFSLRLSADPLELAEGLWWLGEIPASVTPRRRLGETFRDGGWEGDLCFDDSALAWRGPRGIVIITGCSHSGICNIVSRAKSVTGEERVEDIIGGFHLLNRPASEMEEIGAKLREAGVRRMHPCHCTDFSARAALAGSFDVLETGVGDVLEYE